MSCILREQRSEPYISYGERAEEQSTRQVPSKCAAKQVPTTNDGKAKNYTPPPSSHTAPWHTHRTISAASRDLCDNRYHLMPSCWQARPFAPFERSATAPIGNMPTRVITCTTKPWPAPARTHAQPFPTRSGGSPRLARARHGQGSPAPRVKMLPPGRVKKPSSPEIEASSSVTMDSPP